MLRQAIWRFPDPLRRWSGTIYDPSQDGMCVEQTPSPFQFSENGEPAL